MKFSNSLFFVLLTGGMALAAPPENHRADRYKDLYLNSPITDPPVIEPPEEEISDLPDWVLVGVTKYVSSTKVQIMNIKDRTRVVIPSKEASELGFSIKEVVQDRNYLKNTVVTIQKGKDTGEVRFDPKFLVLKKVAGPTASKNQRPGAANQNKTPSRTGNQPPTPPGVRTSNTKTNGGRSTPVKPGAIPQPTTSRPTTTNSGSSKPKTGTSSTATKRTRYVPRPKK